MKSTYAPCMRPAPRVAPLARVRGGASATGGAAPGTVPRGARCAGPRAPPWAAAPRPAPAPTDRCGRPPADPDTPRRPPTRAAAPPLPPGGLRELELLTNSAACASLGPRIDCVARPQTCSLGPHRWGHALIASLGHKHAMPLGPHTCSGHIAGHKLGRRRCGRWVARPKSPSRTRHSATHRPAPHHGLAALRQDQQGDGAVLPH